MDTRRCEKQIDKYPHNEYLTEIGTRKILIQQIQYERTTSRTLLIPLTSLIIPNQLKQFKCNTHLRTQNRLLMTNIIIHMFHLQKQPRNFDIFTKYRT